jgi:signal transduction histidine kinase
LPPGQWRQQLRSEDGRITDGPGIIQYRFHAMTKKCISTAVIYFSLEFVLLTEGIAADTVVMSLCLFVVMALSVLVPENTAAGTIIRCAIIAGCFIAVGVFVSSGAAIFLIPLSVVAALILFYEEIILKKEDEFKKVQDTDRELEMRLRERNKRLIEEQDNEIRLATMAERNRIAREIHDNVGHMLSRALIMLGAIKTIYGAEDTDQGVPDLGGKHQSSPQNAAQTPAMQVYLDHLETTLDTAMHEMRKSVHDLHDDSVDIRKNIDDMISELEESGRCKVVTDIDSDISLDKNIKITLTAILREAVANFLKHSNGDRVEIALHEHPGFVTLSVSDNGTLSKEDKARIETGIGENMGVGLSNIHERAESLGGTASFYTEDGCRVFVNLPKTAKG